MSGKERNRRGEPGRSGLRGLFGALFGSTPESAPAKGGAAKGGESFRDDTHWVNLSLDEMLAGDDDLTVHMISLARFRDAIGETWDRVEGKIMLLAEATIRASVGSTALISRSGVDVFLLVFPKLPPETAHRRTSQAAVTLGQKLVGAKFKVAGDQEDASLCVASLPASNLMGADGRLDPLAVAAMAEAAQPVAGSSPLVAPAEATRKAPTEPDLVVIQRQRAPATEPRLVTMERPTGQRRDLELVPITRPSKPQEPKVRLVPLHEEAGSRRRPTAHEWVPMNPRR